MFFIRTEDKFLIPQDSFRLYFRPLHGIIQWFKLPNSDVICDRDLILGFLKRAMEQHLTWTMERFHIYFMDSQDGDLPSIEIDSILEEVLKTGEYELQGISTALKPFRVFYRDLDNLKWILLPSGDIVCDLDHIGELTVTYLEAGGLKDVDRFDIYYRDSGDVPDKINIDPIVDQMIEKAGIKK